MALKDDLKLSLIAAAKARDQLRLDTVRSIQSAVRYKEIEKRGELTEPEILSVIQTLCKQHRESIEQFKNGGRNDLALKEETELGILEKYLPPQLTREEIDKVVKQVIAETGAQGVGELGRVMKEVMKQLSGKADGKVVNEAVRSLLK